MYLWLKALHIIFMTTWFAGLFYLPRLFVYHTDTHDSLGQQRFCLMEKKLLWIITTPGGILTTLTGFWLSWLAPFWWSSVWLPTKVTIVILLWLFHFCCIWHCRQFAQQKNTYSGVYFRFFNEVPSVILITCVLLVVLKP